MSLSEEWPGELVAPYTMTSPAARAAMAAAVRKADTEKTPGDIVECGVWRGGNIILARLLSPARTCWLYDTFAGMTEPGPLDVSHKGKVALEGYHRRREAGVGWCAASLDEVKAALAETHTFDEGRLRFIVGDVTETLRIPANLPERIAVLRLDTDWHASTRTELEVLWPRLQRGGTLIIDDYGHWKGCREAVDAFFAAKRQPLWKIDYTARMTVKG